MAEPSVPLWETDALRQAAGETLRPGGFALTDRAAEAVGMVPGWRVLDVGCGRGATVSRLRARYGASAWGVDFSPKQLAGAESVSGLVQARGDSLPFSSGVFDAVFCECVFSLFEERERALAEFHRVLAAGGSLVLTDLYGSGGPCSGGSCADRARPVEEVRALLADYGFFVTLAEDHSGHLRDLAARLVWAGAGKEAGCGGRLGYYLITAQKGECGHAD